MPCRFCCGFIESFQSIQPLRFMGFEPIRPRSNRPAGHAVAVSYAFQARSA
jgi:hypothetical protein